MHYVIYPIGMGFLMVMALVAAVQLMRLANNSGFANRLDNIDDHTRRIAQALEAIHATLKEPPPVETAEQQEPPITMADVRKAITDHAEAQRPQAFGRAKPPAGA